LLHQIEMIIHLSFRSGGTARNLRTRFLRSKKGSAE